MFTGIITNMGTVSAVDPIEGGARLTIGRPDSPMDLHQGESIAVNGVCLTVFPSAEGSFHADLSQETLSRTTLGRLRPGHRVNLERAMTLSDRIGGHIVQGHVDAVGTIVATEEQGDFAVFRWRVPEEYARLLVEKGSIAVDGISLTIVAPERNTFAVALIPETLQKTNLGAAIVGSESNIEIDIMAKYAEKFLAPYMSRIP